MAPIRGAVRPQGSYSRSAGVTAPSTTRSNPSSATATQHKAATHRAADPPPTPSTPAPVDMLPGLPSLCMPPDAGPSIRTPGPYWNQPSRRRGHPHPPLGLLSVHSDLCYRVCPTPLGSRADQTPSASLFAATASWSALSLPALCAPADFWCPFTFSHLTSLWRRVASMSLTHRSLFATGALMPLSQPFSRHFSCQPRLMQLTR